MADTTKRYNRKYDEPMSHREQAELYYNVLSRSGAAATFFCTIDEDKKYGQYCTRNESAFVDQFDKHWNSENCYIPLNLFSGEYRYNKKKQKRGWFRTEQDVVAVNGLLVDFDIMKNKGKNPNISYTIKAGDDLVDGLVDEMNDLVDDGKMVYPTLLTKSGRGLQYIILYEEPISKSDEEAKSVLCLKFFEFQPVALCEFFLAASNRLYNQVLKFHVPFVSVAVHITTSKGDM